MVEREMLCHVLRLLVFVLAHVAAVAMRQRVHELHQLVQVVPGHVVTVSTLNKDMRKF